MFGGAPTVKSPTVLTFGQIKMILEVDGLVMSLGYWATKVGSLQARSMAAAVSRVMNALLEQPLMAIGNLDLCNEDDIDILQKWNNFKTTLQEECVHDLISKQAVDNPNSVAVNAWDGQFTYHDLDRLSSNLAVHLQGMGIIPETYVALCFEKSKWLVVSLLAVIKAGAAYVVIEPYYPLKRMKEICIQLQINVLLASSDLLHTASKLSDQVLVVKEGSEYLHDGRNGDEQKAEMSTNNPHNALYVVFSSGSTGNPKGIVVEHSAFVSWGMMLRQAIFLDSQSRVLQFSSFAFLIAHRDVLLTLMLGGCVCMPSESQRLNHLETFMTEYQVNWANLTPSVAALLDPDMTPTLETLLLTSEPMSLSSLTTWEGRVNLIFAYGQGESVSLCCVRHNPTVGSDRKNVGHRIGRSVWLVDPDDHDKLVPVGAVGELVIEGPVLARGYLDAERTALAFLDNAAWVRRLKPGQRGRLYKTGDLAQFTDDGSVRYLSRKDNSTKLYGQRLDIDEVVRHIQGCLAGLSDTTVRDVVVDLCHPPNSNDIKLVAFLGFSRTSPSTSGDVLLGPLDRASAYLQQIKSHLAGLVPRYMIPALVVTVSRIPLNLSGKTDRRRLLELLSRMTPSELDLSMGSNVSHEDPCTDQERSLCSLWSQTLKVAESSIGRHDDFFQRGGDSLAVMKLVSAAHAAGLSLTFGDVFANPLLLDQANLMGSGQDQEQRNYICAPFELITKSRKHAVIVVAARECALSESQIEDIYPATPIQEGLIALNALRPGSYVSQRVYKIESDGFSVSRFKAAWNATLDTNPPLRTRFIRCSDDGSTYQVVVRTEFKLDSHNDLENYLAQDRASPMNLGSPLVRLCLIASPRGEVNLCVVTMHHCIYDAWSMSVLLDQVHAVYHGNILDPQPFSGFVKYVQQSNENASEYWRTEMADVQAEQFPALPSTTHYLNTTESETLDIPLPPRNATANITLSTCLQLAWAVTLANYTRLDDVVFGLTVSGRGSPVPGIDKMAGPTIATFPLRVQLRPASSINEELQALQSRVISTMPFGHFGMQNISRVGDDAARACRFQSLLVIQQSQSTSKRSGILRSIEGLGIAAQATWDTYALTVLCTPADDDMIYLEAVYDAAVVPKPQVQRTLQVFAHVLSQIALFPDRKVGGINCISAEDLHQLQVWNSSVSPAVLRCVHDMIHDHCLSQPDAIAVDAWDGQLTYGQLDQWSSLVSVILREKGLHRDMFVPLCFEKSKWVAVAILAVAKGGGAFILLDPSHPPQRLAWICNNAHATMILCSKDFSALAAQICDRHVVQVDEGIIGETQSASPTASTLYQTDQILPSNAICAIYTSGSSGTPKGAVMEHSAFATQITALGPRYHLNRQSRVFQFASHAFDVAVSDYLFTLALGGCLCVPKEAESRDSLTGAMRDLKANWTFLTPSVARTLDPRAVPELKLLVLGGESAKPVDFTIWSGAVRLIYVYGPAECTIYATLQTNTLPNANPTNIGSGVAAACWLVDPNDPEKLVPIGAVGELLIEGPIVGRCYLGDEELSNSSFISPPSWLRALRPGKYGKRLYKSGDMLRYSPVGNGSLEFVGRRDKQVKLRGQRMELAEIEHQVTQSFPMATDTVVELVIPSGLDTQKLLVAFIWDGANSAEQRSSPNTGTLPETNLFVSPDRSFELRSSSAELALRKSLPSFMVPSLFIPLKKFPLGPTGKVNRRLIKEQACLLSRKELSVYQSFQTSEKIPPSNESEIWIRQVVSDVLGLCSNEVGMNDNFFHLGGDSISSMVISTRATENGLRLTAAHILAHPRLRDMASVAMCDSIDDSSSFEEHPPPLPFSLLQTSHHHEELMREVTQQCNTDRSNVEDIYPCTPLQEGLFALTIKQPGAYVFKFTLELAQQIDVDRFHNAWNTVVEANTILRTRIVCASSMGGSLVQAVMRKTSYRSTPLAADQCPVGLGEPLFCIQILAPDEEANGYRAVVTIHHALYDGVSLGMIMTQVSAAYCNGDSPVSQPYSCFIRHCLSLPAEDQIKDFWDAELGNATCPSFKAASIDSYLLQTPKYTERRIAIPSDAHLKSPLSAALKLAWGIVLSRFTGEGDVVFGTVVSGRMANLRGIEKICGPTIATLPFRIRHVPSMIIQEALDEVQTRTLGMIPFEQTGLQRIRQLGYADACRFQSLLIIQFSEDEDVPDSPLYKFIQGQPTRTFHTYPLTITCIPSAESVHVRATFDSGVIPMVLVDRLLDQYSRVLMHIHTVAWEPVSSIPSQSIDDGRRMWAWNETVPRREDTCVHEIITSNTGNQRGASAVCAWDGDLTYEELEDMSTRLAAHLRNSGVGVETMVPLCFEKSRWAVVATLAVLKAGGSFVPLDTSQAASRRDTILTCIEAKVIVTSAQYASTLAAADRIIIPVDDASIRALPMVAPSPTSGGQASSPAYVFFTSGSTGQPKGVVVDHGALSTSCLSHGSKMGFNEQTRMLQFTAYTFDISLMEIFTTLIYGGCICVPSDADRFTDLELSADTMKVNAVSLTASVARLVEPCRIPSVQKIIFVGENATDDDFKRWAHLPEIFDAYGPTECTIFCSINKVQVSHGGGSHIGKAVGSVSWVVSPDDHNQLAPIGAVGELLVEGPILARGYLGDVEKTSAVFIEDPPWLVQGIAGHPGRRGRLYKTGDLVRYNEDGSLIYYGRKDTQTKIRGHRVELGEVECHVCDCVAGVNQAVVVATAPDAGGVGSVLAAFLCFADAKHSAELEDDVRAITIPWSTKDTLADRLPPYMMPSIYLAIGQFPLNTSGKMDRRRLQHIATNHFQSRLANGGMNKTEQQQNGLGYPPSSLPSKFRDSSNETEKRLKEAWATVLGVQSETISVDDNFYDLGGDSIRVISLMRLIQNEFGIHLASSLINSRNTTIAKISQFIDTKSEAATLDLEGEIEASLSSTWTDAVSQPWFNPSKLVDAPVNVFLTGGTGFLGTQILRCLLSSNKVERIAALVRAASAGQGLERLKKTAAVAGWWRTEYEKRIEVWTGDLGLPKLGLSDPQWQRLSGTAAVDNIEAIIHNGAVVNWNMDYDSLRAPNVLSTIDLLKIAAMSRSSRRFVFVSGGTIAELNVSRGNTAAFDQISRSNGYIQSKFVAEAIVRRFVSQLPLSQNRFSVIKPGMVIGTTEEGVANLDDFIWRVVAAASRLKLYPLETEESWVPITDAGFIATQTVAQVLSNDIDISSYVNIASKFGLRASDFWEQVNSELRHTCEPVRWSLWVERALNDTNQVGESHPLWPVQQFVKGRKHGISIPSPLSPPNRTALCDAVKANVRYLAQVGYLECQKGNNSDPQPGIFNRSTAVPALSVQSEFPTHST
jgi:amino acid adenylation domain-containing protein/thioester reductase-like protein